MLALQELSALKPHAFDAGLVFSGTASGTAIQGFEEASSYTPKAALIMFSMIQAVILLSGF